MSNATLQQSPVFTSEVVYQLPYSGDIIKDSTYGNDASQVMDIYYPEKRKSLMPAVIFVTGFPDAGLEAMIGKKLKEVMWYVSWAKLIAASGFIAITYSNADPEKDIWKLYKHLNNTGESLGIDTQRMGLIACSGNVPNALSVLMFETTIKCATLCYGYTLDLNNSEIVDAAKKTYGFVTPKGKDRSFPDSSPMLITRAGKDENAGLNTALDQFITEALSRNAPIELINFPGGKHAFDMFDNSKESIRIVKRVLEFFRSYLLD